MVLYCHLNDPGKMRSIKLSTCNTRAVAWRTREEILLLAAAGYFYLEREKGSPISQKRSP